MLVDRPLTLYLPGVVMVAVALAGCASTDAKLHTVVAHPQVKLERVEVASYFPYAPPPARVPLVLSFVFNVTNPTSRTVTMEELRFSYAFEAKPEEYFTLGSPVHYDTIHIPPQATNKVRVVSVLDSAVVPATLATTQGFRLKELGLKGPDLVKDWWEKSPNFEYGIRVSAGAASFATPKGSILVSFQDSFVHGRVDPFGSDPTAVMKEGEIYVLFGLLERADVRVEIYKRSSFKQPKKIPLGTLLPTAIPHQFNVSQHSWGPGDYHIVIYGRSAYGSVDYPRRIIISIK